MPSAIVDSFKSFIKWGTGGTLDGTEDAVVLETLMIESLIQKRLQEIFNPALKMTWQRGTVNSTLKMTW